MKRKMMYVLGTFILCLMITPNVAKAWEGSGGGGGTNLQDCSSDGVLIFAILQSKIKS